MLVLLVNATKLCCVVCKRCFVCLTWVAVSSSRFRIIVMKRNVTLLVKVYLNHFCSLRRKAVYFVHEKRFRVVVFVQFELWFSFLFDIDTISSVTVPAPFPTRYRCCNSLSVCGCGCIGKETQQSISWAATIRSAPVTWYTVDNTAQLLKPCLWPWEKYISIPLRSLILSAAAFLHRWTDEVSRWAFLSWVRFRSWFLSVIDRSFYKWPKKSKANLVIMTETSECGEF